MAFLEHSRILLPRLAITALLTGLLFASGCGGGGDSEASGSDKIVNNPAPSSSSSSSSSSSTNSSSGNTSSSNSSSSSSSSSTSSSSNSSSSNSSSSSSSGNAPGFDDTYCENFTAVASDVSGNMYRFVAPANNCFGIVADGSQKKTVPLKVPELLPDDSLQIGSTIKLFNSTQHVAANIDTIITFNLTNTSDEPLCFVVPSQPTLTLYDSANNAIASVESNSYLEGALYYLPFSPPDATNTCINPGQTLRYFDSMDGIAYNTFEEIDYATFSGLNSRYIDEPQQPDLAVTELTMAHPSVVVNFVNTAQVPISFETTFTKIAFFDEEGYTVNWGYLNLPDASDSDTVESGDAFTMSGSPLHRGIWPATAVEAIVFLDWNYLN